MNKSLVIVIIIFLCTVGASAGENFIVKDSVARGRIYLPETFGAATMLAAEELKTYIDRMTGSDITIQYGPYDENRRKRTRQTAIILKPDAIGPAAEGSVERDQFEVVSDKATITIQAPSETGVLFGVYTWLDGLGVRWFAPGELGEVVPRRRSIPITPGHVAGKPAYWSRNLWYNGNAYWHFRKSDHYVQDFNAWWRWCLRNRLDLLVQKRISKYHGIARPRINNQHYIHRAALKGVDIKEEPERFALYHERTPDKRFPDGIKREGGYRVATDNICMTHPKNIAQAAEHAIQYLKDRPQMMIAPMSLGDFSGVCECDRCRAANGGTDPRLDPNRVVWKFMNKVSNRVARALPGKGVGFYACYGKMTRPPEGMEGAPTSMALVTHVACNAHDAGNEACPHNKLLLDHMAAIKATGSRIKMRAYTMWYGRFQPLAILDSIRTFRDRGVDAYSCEVMGRDELRNITHWCMARLLWDPSTEPQELLEEFTNTYYGAAGPKVLQVLQLIDKQVRTYKRIVFKTYFDMLTPELIGQLRDLTASARDKVDGIEAKRLATFTLSLEMVLRRVEVNRLLVVLNQERSGAALAKAKEAWGDFVAWIEAENVLDSCSPSLLRAMGNVEKKLAAFKAELTPRPRKDVAEGGKAARIDALYTNVAKPDQMPAITLLPDLWRFRNDLDRSGQEKGWHKADFDDSKWHSLNVYNFIGYQGFFRSAPHFWYRTRFKAPVIPNGKQLIMRIGALDDGGTIYVNGKQVHKRLHMTPNDWQSSFEFEITNAVKPGQDNVVAVHGIDHMGAAGLWRGAGIYTR
jgi:hypothetical protein